MRRCSASYCWKPSLLTFCDLSLVKSSLATTEHYQEDLASRLVPSACCTGATGSARNRILAPFDFGTRGDDATTAFASCYHYQWALKVTLHLRLSNEHDFRYLTSQPVDTAETAAVDYYVSENIPVRVCNGRRQTDGCFLARPRSPSIGGALHVILTVTDTHLVIFRRWSF